jgi:hypothetical protein
MTCAVLWLLQNKFKTAIGAELRFHSIRLMTHDQQPALWREVPGTGEHAFHKSGSREGLQHLWERTFHTGAFPSSKNGNGEHETGARPAKSTGGTPLWEHINNQLLQSDTH